MPCPNRYTSTAALWPLRIILALETVTISNFQQGQRLSLAASPNRPPKVSRFSSDSCLALSLDSSLLVELHGVHDGFRVWGILEIGTRWIVSCFFLSSEKEIGRE